MCPAFPPVFFSRIRDNLAHNLAILSLILFSVSLPSCRPPILDVIGDTVKGAPAPSFPDNITWLNAERPLSMADLKGRVVLVYFWSSCSINAVRAIPYVNDWYAQYQDYGLSVVGIHSPQFGFEKEAEGIRRVLSRLTAAHPVVLDNDFALWSRYQNHAWPTFYLIDHTGFIREVVVGEGKYDEIESLILALLIRAGYEPPEMFMNPHPDVEFSRLGTPEIHAGYGELSHFGSPEPVLADQIQAYGADSPLELNHFYLVGDWEIGEERARLRGMAGKLLIRYDASRLYGVLSSLHGERLRAEVLLDGEALTTENYGKDIWFRDGKSFIEIDHPRIYEMVNTDGDYGEHVLEIVFTQPDVEIYSFMFG